MTRKFSTLLLAASASVFLVACSGSETSLESKAADAPIDTLSAEALEQKAAEAANQGSAVNAPFNAFLAKYVAQKDGINLIAYGKVTDADEAKLEAYIDTLSNTDISDFSDDEIKAYWFNLYNAKTVDLILDHYPTNSIRDIKRPWNAKRLTVNGQEMSLNNIEHDTVREMYDEPRVHFAFNCASIGCPNVKTTAWEAETLEADLTQSSIDYVASPRGITVDENGKIIASEIFKWYRGDFGKNEKEVLTYLSQFAEGRTKAAMQSATKVDKYIYDWSLNVAE